MIHSGLSLAGSGFFTRVMGTLARLVFIASYTS